MDDTFSDSRWKMERQNRLATCEGETNQWSSCNCVPWCQEYSGWERNRTARREWASLETIGPLGKFKTDTFQKLNSWMRKPCCTQGNHPQGAEQFRVGGGRRGREKHGFRAPTLTDRQKQKRLNWYYMIFKRGSVHSVVFLSIFFFSSFFHLCTCIHFQDI